MSRNWPSSWKKTSNIIENIIRKMKKIDRKSWTNVGKWIKRALKYKNKIIQNPQKLGINLKKRG